MSGTAGAAGAGGVPVFVGVDLGGTKIHLGLATAHDEPAAQQQIATPSHGAAALLDALAGAIVDLLGAAGAERSQLAGIGLGGAGVPLPSGGFDDAPNLGDVSFDLAAALSERFACPVALENDVNVAALGELHCSDDPSRSSFALVAVGTGIGMGLVLDGQLVRGHRNAAGEIGYLPFGADPFDVRNQVRGPLEEVVAGDALTARDPGARSAREVFDRAAAGVRDAQEALEVEARWIAQAIAAVITVADPEHFILGGGIGSRPELAEPVRRWLARLGFPGVSLAPSRLGSTAAVIGAIELARRVGLGDRTVTLQGAQL